MFEAGDLVRYGTSPFVERVDRVYDTEFGTKIDTTDIESQNIGGTYFVENVTKVELFTFFDLCAAYEDAWERYPHGIPGSIIERIFGDISLYDQCHFVNETYLRWHEPLPPELSWVYDYKLIREVTDA